MSAARAPFNEETLPRIICLVIVVILHILLLLFLIFDIDVTQIIPDPPTRVMKLTDVQEYVPLPPPPPPPPPPAAPKPVPTPSPIIPETIAEEIIEVEELEPQVEVSAPAVTENSTESSTGGSIGGGNTGPNYLPQNQISVIPKFDRAELQRRTVYPPIARRSNIEGSVVLELFIDREGYVRNIVVLKETPEGRGFAEAAVKAFQGFRAISPAQANGEDVAVRYRWPVRFTLR